LRHNDFVDRKVFESNKYEKTRKERKELLFIFKYENTLCYFIINSFFELYLHGYRAILLQSHVRAHLKLFLFDGLNVMLGLLK
jgi:hypothetical protein